MFEGLTFLCFKSGPLFTENTRNALLAFIYLQLTSLVLLFIIYYFTHP